jgi:branched-chain amino acid transport system ATP-binding protein
MSDMLEVRAVSKHFGSLRAVDDVTLMVAPGELRAIIGPNGAGKTTFFNLISGFFPPTTGEIAFDGEVITQLPVAARVARGMARTFQITEIFPELTVRENVRIGAESAAGLRLALWRSRAEATRIEATIDEMLTLTGLTAQSDRLVGEMSHGDQRAAEIAMALTLKPRLLLLDEPTAGMGEHETYQIAGLIRRLHRNSNYTIVLIEHDMRVVFNLADRITVLDQGKLLADGTPKEIADNPRVQEAYLGTAVDAGQTV